MERWKDDGCVGRKCDRGRDGEEMTRVRLEDRRKELGEEWEGEKKRGG
jgi:hypothetical protein